MVNQILDEFLEERRLDEHYGWKKVIEIFLPKLEVMVFYGFQAW
jgi:hypothetical protein